MQGLNEEYFKLSSSKNINQVEANNFQRTLIIN